MTNNKIPSSLPRQFSKRTKLFLTADEHYFHNKIIQYTGRPFSDAYQMNLQLIENHNSLVGIRDHVIHIGDFVLGNVSNFISILRSLNGIHYFMEGNHDQALAKYIDSSDKPKDVESRVIVLPKYFEFTYNGHPITLCHYAGARWNRSHHGSYHFFGHSHGTYTSPQGKAIDVGVDCHEYFPITIERAMERADLYSSTPIIELEVEREQ